jgi:hypothetical protein
VGKIVFSLQIYIGYIWKGFFHPLMAFGAKLLQEDGNFHLEKGKTCKEKPVGSWVGTSMG